MDDVEVETDEDVWVYTDGISKSEFTELFGDSDDEFEGFRTLSFVSVSASKQSVFMKMTRSDKHL